jgi:hypothetical protein
VVRLFGRRRRAQQRAAEVERFLAPMYANPNFGARLVVDGDRFFMVDRHGVELPYREGSRHG